MGCFQGAKVSGVEVEVHIGSVILSFSIWTKVF